jgi:phosphotransferase system enzyme I (PtsI)
MSRIVRGVGVSSGVAVGRVHLLHAPVLPEVAEPIPVERVEREIDEFHRARETARDELADLRDQVRDALGEAFAGILDAQRLILDDPALVDEVATRIRVGRVSARWALREAVADLARRFERVADAYLRERAGELADVHRRMQRLLARRAQAGGGAPDGPLVVVAHALGPSEAIQLTRERVVGLATDVGSRTSHTAIMAQALSLPAVVGLHDLSGSVREGDPVVLDGDAGVVIVDPDETETADAEIRRRARLAAESAMESTRDVPAVTTDGVEVVVRANIELPSEVDAALRFGAHGVGLYRSEFLFLSRAPRLPTEDEHFETCVGIASRVAPHPFHVRTLDLGGEKYFQEVLGHDEPNPVLGLRAVRFCLRRPDVFRPQLRGLLRAAAVRDNIRILLPLVTVVEEIREVRALIARESEDLAAEGRAARRDVPLGIMIEVPAAAMAADLLARHADFLSIGTNDLAQYALAVDRSNESLAHLYRPFHPGLLRMIREVVEAGRRASIPVTLCGEMAADPQAIALLVGLGLRELSVQPRAVGAVRQAVRAVDARDAARAAALATAPGVGDDAGWPVGADGSLPGEPV